MILLESISWHTSRITKYSHSMRIILRKITQVLNMLQINNIRVLPISTVNNFDVKRFSVKSIFGTAWISETFHVNTHFQ